METDEDEEAEEAAGASAPLTDAWCLWDLDRFEPSAAGTSAAKVESSSLRFDELASRWLGAGEEVRETGGDMGRSGGRGARMVPMICKGKRTGRESVSGRHRAASRLREERRRRPTCKLLRRSLVLSLLLWNVDQQRGTG